MLVHEDYGLRLGTFWIVECYLASHHKWGDWDVDTDILRFCVYDWGDGIQAVHTYICWLLRDVLLDRYMVTQWNQVCVLVF